LLTAISDLEVQQVETKGHLWHFNYPLEGKTYDAEDSSTFITVATTRPETMLGDTAVAVHPDNEKLGHLIGKNIVLPLVGRIIPIVGDTYADPEKGTGAVKITPAHDFNDFEVGKRHNLSMINILDAEGRLLLENNEEFSAGLKTSSDLAAVMALHHVDRAQARKAIVAMMEERALCPTIEPHMHIVPHGDRSGVVIEPWLTDQWYVDAHTLAQPALKAVREGKTSFIPKNWEKTYFDWLENIQPWCISRQLWWGHQIPAWYAPDGEVFVAMSEEEAQAQAEKQFGHKVELKRDEDVLDTWFSSALWPFSTLGWPDHAPEVKRYYPTSVLVTGFDIIFFWVARMMMMGIHFMGEIPFKDVYIHALVRDEKGAKMSKSKGNVIDPLNLVDTYGADALRFTLAAMAAQGRDIKLATSRVEGYRNFATKLWNASRFAEMNGCARVAGFAPDKVTLDVNRWILGEAQKAVADVSGSIQAYRFNDAANGVYRFVWNIFCDWYVELTKPILQGEDGAGKDETRATTAYVIDVILKLLHPFMPFLTEELWAIKGADGPARNSLLVLADWPALKGLEHEGAEAEIGWMVDLISEIRSVRSEMNVPASAQMPLVLVGGTVEMKARAERGLDTLKRLARVSDLSFSETAPANSAQMIVRGALVALPLEGIIDISAEKVRLEKEIAKLDGEVKKIDAKLGNADFVARAPEEVVEENRERRADAVSRIEKMSAALKRLS
jgi:valyl-tRNA synthetase